MYWNFYRIILIHPWTEHENIAKTSGQGERKEKEDLGKNVFKTKTTILTLQ